MSNGDIMCFHMLMTEYFYSENVSQIFWHKLAAAQLQMLMFLYFESGEHLELTFGITLKKYAVSA